MRDLCQIFEDPFLDTNAVGADPAGREAVMGAVEHAAIIAESAGLDDIADTLYRLVRRIQLRAAVAGDYRPAS